MRKLAACTPSPRSTADAAETVLALLSGKQDGSLLRTALAMTDRNARRVLAWSLPDPQHELRSRLQSTALGFRGNSEADRALRYMIETARRGHHVPVRRLSHETRARAEQLAEIRAGSPGRLLVTGWSRGSEVPDDPSFAAIIKEHDGPVLLLMDAPAEPFTAALLVAVDAPAAAETDLEALARGLEPSYPCWQRRVASGAELEPLLQEVTPSDLVIILPGATRAAEFDALLDRLHSAAGTTTVGVLLPHTGKRDRLLAWLADGKRRRSAAATGPA